MAPVTVPVDVCLAPTLSVALGDREAFVTNAVGTL